jgi:PilZ domain
VNNRLHDRVDCKTLALVKAGNITIRGEVENLSLKGLFVKTCTTIPMNETVDVTLFFMGDTERLSFNLVGKVERITDEGIGLSFKRIDVDSLMQDAIAGKDEQSGKDAAAGTSGGPLALAI